MKNPKLKRQAMSFGGSRLGGVVVLAGMAAAGVVLLLLRLAGSSKKNPLSGISESVDTYSVAGEEDPGAAVDAPVPPPRPPHTH